MKLLARAASVMLAGLTITACSSADEYPMSRADVHARLVTADLNMMPFWASHPHGIRNETPNKVVWWVNEYDHIDCNIGLTELEPQLTKVAVDCGAGETTFSKLVPMTVNGFRRQAIMGVDSLLKGHAYDGGAVGELASQWPENTAKLALSKKKRDANRRAAKEAQYANNSGDATASADWYE